MAERMTAPTWRPEDRLENIGYAPLKPITSETTKTDKVMDCYTMSEVEREYVRFLWDPYIPAGKLTLLEGDPGIGKTWISIALACCIAGGETLPGMKGSHVPQKVLYATCEDGIHDTLKGRIEDFGANFEAQSNIFCPKDLFTLDEDCLQMLQNTLDEFACGIVFIDPIVGYLEAGMDMNKANEVRSVMKKLHAIAEHTGAAIIAIRHLRKSPAGGKGKGNTLYDGIGSIDFTGAARSVIQVRQDKLGQCYIAHEKSNLAFKGPRLAYSVDYTEEFGVCPFKWTGEYSDADFDDGSSVCTTRKKDECSTFIFDLLRDGEQPAVQLREDCLKAGYSVSTIKRAKKECGVLSKKLGNGGWVWYLEAREGIAT